MKGEAGLDDLVFEYDRRTNCFFGMCNEGRFGTIDASFRILGCFVLVINVSAFGLGMKD